MDALFLDIQMAGMTGFELLQHLPFTPSIIFTTAFDRDAVNALEVSSVNYLVKPMEAPRLGIVFVDFNEVTHFYSKDKLTHAATARRRHIVDVTIAELEAKLDPADHTCAQESS